MQIMKYLYNICILNHRKFQLQASGADQVQKLVWLELQCQNVPTHNSHQQFAMQLTDVEEEEEEELATEAPALVIESRATKDSSKAPGKYPFPFANNRSKKVPPHPCWNCGNPLHYDHDCASWRNQGHPENKPRPASKTNKAYSKAYLAMLEEDNSSYDTHCTTYNASLDPATLAAEAFMAQSM